MSGPLREIVRPSKDELDREVIAQVSAAIAALNSALAFAAERKIRVEVGTVSSDSVGKKARNWRGRWFEDGLAVRFTREEIFASPKPAPPIVRPSKDELDREVIAQVSAAIAALNSALAFAAERKIRVEVGTVSSDSVGKKARNWRGRWFEDGLVVRFTREEIFASPKPAPPVVDAEPRIGA